jgi:4-oxalocrotonate tautomerase
MPHVIIKIYPKTEEQKKRLAKAITDSIVEITGNEEKAVSITFEEVTPEEWPEKVYRPDILEKQNMLYKKPGYNPFSK